MNAKKDVGYCPTHNRYFDRDIEPQCGYCESVTSKVVCDSCAFKKAECEMKVPGFPTLVSCRWWLENDDQNIGVLE